MAVNILKLTLPGKDEPETDLRTILAYIIQRLRDDFFAGPEQLTANFKLQDAMTKYGFSPGAGVTLNGLLQQTGLVQKISSRNNGRWQWFVYPEPDRITERFPAEAIEAALRRHRDATRQTTEVGRLRTRLEAATQVRSGGGPDEAFMADIARKVQELARQRDEATAQRDEAAARANELADFVRKLEEQVDSLKQQLDTRRVSPQDFSAWLDSVVQQPAAQQPRKPS